MKSLQASMILRNEEAMLPKALDSLKGIDSIMICDTGSSDSSFDIYQQYKDKGYNIEWFKYSRFDTENHIKDFSHARNECKEKCTGDWLFILDGDEFCEFDIGKVKKMINSGWTGKYEVLTVHVKSYGKESTELIEKTDQPRVFRNNPTYWYVGAAHNSLMIIENGQPMVFGQSRLYKTTFLIEAHYSPNHDADPNRTLDILTEALKANPYDTRYMYYIAREWLNRQDPLKALFYLERYVEIAQPNPETADAWFIIATIYLDMNMVPKASESAMKAVWILPSYKRAWEIVHGLSSKEFKEYWKVILDKADNKHVMFVR